MKILVLNSGSSSIKYRLFFMPSGKVLAKGTIERIGEKKSPIKNHRQALGNILKGMRHINAVGHRVVHGGEKFKSPCIISKDILKKIEQLKPLAPLHNPANITGIKEIYRVLPHTVQVAVFDTAFHQGMRAPVYMYALPFDYYSKFGIRRYGFHGTSHEYVANRAAKILKKPLSRLKLITCHLGNGCSIAAISGGCSIDTSMGFTPLEGLVMGTRCGDIDPELVFYLKKRLGVSWQSLRDILNKQSGLKGLSGISNDLREIKRAARTGNKRARLALEVFIHRLKKYISAYFGILGGADAIVFTGGIGENHPDIIKKATLSLSQFLRQVKTKILVIPTDEELIIAQKTYQLVKRKAR